MTFKEKLIQEFGKEAEFYTILSCPYNYGYEKKKPCKEHCSMSCSDCWNREIQGTKKTKQEEKEMGFTKADLKEGMVVETMEGNRFFVFNGKLRREQSFLKLEDYKDDLTFRYPGVKCFDIMKVFKSTSYWTLGNVLTDVGSLVWERKRKEEKELTVAEIEKLLGFNVKIVKE